MKAIVKPTASHIYMIPGTPEVIEASRPSVVSVTEFVKSLALAGKIKPIVSELPDTANDADFFKFYTETKGDEELAIQSYVASLEKTAEEQEDEALKQQAAAESAAAEKAAAEVKESTDAVAADTVVVDDKAIVDSAAAAAAAPKAPKTK